MSRDQAWHRYIFVLWHCTDTLKELQGAVFPTATFLDLGTMHYYKQQLSYTGIRLAVVLSLVDLLSTVVEKGLSIQSDYLSVC